MEQQPSEVIEKRREKIDELKESGIELFPNDFTVTHTVQEISDAVVSAEAVILNDPEQQADILLQLGTFSMAGRVMAINRFGKSSFIRLRDRSGQMQAYIQQNKVGEALYGLFKKLDIGDFLGVSGTLFTTKTGEKTLLAEDFKLLAKSYRPLPEKFHGLKDPEKRYRQRYLDLAMNTDVREVFVKRTRLLDSIRRFLAGSSFMEVETPMMQVVPGGADARPFKTYHNALGMDLYLRIAPELYLKRLLVGGFERVFEINRNFRNEGISTQHNPEFTMLEFYQAYATYEDLMTLTEAMFAQAATDVCGKTKICYQGNDIEFGGKWQRMDLLASIVSIGGVPSDVIKDLEKLRDFSVGKGIKISGLDGKPVGWGKLITKIFDNLVEPHLVQPTFITGYPTDVSPLSRRSRENPDIADRFELFIAGREIANGFSELNDPVDQKQRFMQQVESKEMEEGAVYTVDEDYIEALEYGMPPAAGEGVGIDRLAMLLTDAPSIRDVILFPHLKPVEKKNPQPL
jgi:lysyl-tRNA synthetase, class II